MISQSSIANPANPRPSKAVDRGSLGLQAAMPSPIIVSLLLFAATLLLYLPALSSGFVNYDDPAYVTNNPQVLQGLSWSNIAWAFTATTEANWHPLTWISHMADVQLFGLNPRGHHFTSVVLHGLNVVILFLVLSQATQRRLRSAVVALLFAIHPLNVECVAWIAERKSLLSMFFLLLALAAYGWYSSHRNFARYALVFLLFALALAAKPMVVTLPALLLLWDYWPLDRATGAKETSDRSPGLAWLFIEKIPLFALSAASSWITLYAQHIGGALGSTDLLPLRVRIENAIYSYFAYVVKGIWPSGLAVFYPHPENSLALWKILIGAAFLVAGSVLAWQGRKTHRYVLTGWLWYLVALAPMIGVVQVGRQAMADRYAYLPFVGFFILAVWGVAEFFDHLNLSNSARTAVTAALLIGYASAAFLQIGYWRNSYTLFSHALAVTSHNGIAEDNLGTALMEMGRPDLALPHFEAAAEFIPQLSTAHYNLGVLQQQQGHLDIARDEYELALQYSSDATEIAQAHSNLGFLLMGLNDLDEAKEQFSAALRLTPDKQNSLLGRGITEYRLSDFDGAIKDLSRAAEIAPLAAADFWWGKALEAKGQPEAAAAAYEAALQLAPNMAEAQQRLSALRSAH